MLLAVVAQQLSALMAGPRRLKRLSTGHLMDKISPVFAVFAVALLVLLAVRFCTA